MQKQKRYCKQNLVNMLLQLLSYRESGNKRKCKGHSKLDLYEMSIQEFDNSREETALNEELYVFKLLYPLLDMREEKRE